MAGGLRLTQTLHRQATLFPDRIALSDVNGPDGYRANSEQCLQSVSRLAGGLLEDGLQPGDRVAILAGNSARHVELLYAVFWAGGVAVPLNWRWAGPELSHALADSEAAVLIVDRLHDETGRWAASSCPGMRSIIPIETLEGPRAEDTGRGGGELALIVYPDGETGLAEAVHYSHEWLTARAVRDPADGPATASAQLLATPLFEPAAFMWAFNTLAHGHQLIIDDRFEPGEMASVGQREGVTDMAVTPSMVTKMLHQPEADFHFLERLHVQTSALPPASIMAFHKVFPDIRLVQSAEMR